MELSVNLQDLASNDLQRLAAIAEGEDIRAVIGDEVLNELQDHYIRVNETHPNKMGANRTNFYAQAAESTHYTETGDGLLFETDAPVGLRVRMEGTGYLPGGVISAKAGKYLAIPAIAAAYAHSPREFGNLRYVQFGRGEDAPKALVEKDDLSAYYESTGMKVKRNAGSRNKTAAPDAGEYKNRVFYWLVASVAQQGDPTVIPDAARIENAINHAIKTYYEALQGEIKT